MASQPKYTTDRAASPRSDTVWPKARRNNVNVIDLLKREQEKQQVPILRSGDTVRVHVKVVEGTREPHDGAFSGGSGPLIDKVVGHRGG